MRLQNSPHYDMCGFITYGRRLKYYEIAERPVYYFETEENIEYVLDKFGIEAILFGNYANAKAESDRLIKYCVTHGVKVLIAPADRRDRRRETGASGRYPRHQDRRPAGTRGDKDFAGRDHGQFPQTKPCW